MGGRVGVQGAKELGGFRAEALGHAKGVSGGDCPPGETPVSPPRGATTSSSAWNSAPRGVGCGAPEHGANQRRNRVKEWKLRAGSTRHAPGHRLDLPWGALRGHPGVVY